MEFALCHASSTLPQVNVRVGIPLRILSIMQEERGTYPLENRQPAGVCGRHLGGGGGQGWHELARTHVSAACIDPFLPVSTSSIWMSSKPHFANSRCAWPILCSNWPQSSSPTFTALMLPCVRMRGGAGRMGRVVSGQQVYWEEERSTYTHTHTRARAQVAANHQRAR